MQWTKIFRPIQDWIIHHPALFSGFLIYAYYLFTSSHFLLDFYGGGEDDSLTFVDYVSEFDALPFMWLLAFALVRLLQYQEKIHEQEKKALERQRQVEVQKAQFRTLQEVTIALMDKINNPAAVIVMHARRLGKRVYRPAAVQTDIEAIRKAAFRISKILTDLSSMEEYKFLEQPYGRMVDFAEGKE